MRVKVQLIIETEDGISTDEVALIEKPYSELADMGLTLEDSHTILSTIQERLITEQTHAYLDAHRDCPDCGKRRRKKGSYPILFRTLFGNVRLQSERLYHCHCQQHDQKTCSPLMDLFTEHTSPELLYMETKWASLAPFGFTAERLKEVLPISRALNAATVRNHLHRVAKRAEETLGEENHVYIDGCPRDWGQLPPPDLPITVGLDGGYVRNWDDKKKHFEVIAGKSVPDKKEAKYFGFVQTYDEKPRRRLFELLSSQGMQMNQQITFFSDGGDTVRELPHLLNPFSEHILDWFHITMRLTVLRQYFKGVVRADEEQGQALQRLLESVKWYLWHGNHQEALSTLGIMEDKIFAIEETYPKYKKLEKTFYEFTKYIKNNTGGIVNYGERWRYGETISTAFVESTVNVLVGKRFCKKQQMQWRQEGAHLLLQTRTSVLNEELDDQFRRWYPGFRKQAPQELKQAA